jgi:hypothetical protein
MRGMGWRDWIVQRALTQALRLCLLLLAAPVLAQDWTPNIVKEPHLFVRVQVLGVHPPANRELGSSQIEAAPGRPARWTLPIDFPITPSQRAVSIEVTVGGGPAAGGDSLIMHVTTNVIVDRGGQLVSNERNRDLEVSEGSSVLHSAYENAMADASITVILTPETRIVPAVARAIVSAPIAFKVTLLQRWEGRLVPVEDNILRTMEGGAVSYAFSQVAAAAAAELAAGAGEALETESREGGSPAREVRRPGSGVGERFDGPSERRRNGSWRRA